MPERTPDPGHPGREIRVLPDHVIDQIAAGEVIERPASVVKELVENALDAGATHVNVEVESGGKRLIRVLDNGTGMTEDEVRLALTRHATSKLRALDDLFRLDTMGFRGEALPSIAAVSRMSITTRTRGDVAGTRLDIEAGQVLSAAQVGAPVGTHIEVRDLLFNVPARLKFLKGNATEASHVTDAVTKLAMVHPAVHLRLRHGGRVAVDAPPHPSGLERARAILGTRLGRTLHGVGGTESGVRVQAYLAAPDLAQSTTRSTYLFVGRRAVKDRGLLHALGMGYGELVPKGRFPVAVLCVDVPGEDLDVNVHPQKLEVRFSDAQVVYAAVRHVVRRGVAEAPWLAEEQTGSPVRMRATAASEPPRERAASRMASSHAAETTRMLLPFGRAGGGSDAWEQARDRARRDRPGAAWQDSPAQARSPAPDAGAGAGVGAGPGSDAGARQDLARGGDAAGVAAPVTAPVTPGTQARRSGSERDDPEGAGRFLTRTMFPVASPDWQAPAREPGAASRAAEPGPWPYDRESGRESARTSGREAGRETGRGGGRDRAHEAGRDRADPAPGEHDEPRDAGEFFARLRYIGQLDRTYLVCEAGGEMVLVDQHAAHERVAFQRLRERYQQRAVPVQALLFPKTLELAPAQAAVVEDAGATLSDMGFDLEPFGGSTYALKAVPAGLRESDVEQVLGELLDELAERGGSRALEERLDLALATIACHSVVRAGDVLGEQEVRALFQSLDQVAFKAHCPHGRPVLLRISVDEIARRFGR